MIAIQSKNSDGKLTYTSDEDQTFSSTMKGVIAVMLYNYGWEEESILQDMAKFCKEELEEKGYTKCPKP